MSDDWFIPFYIMLSGETHEQIIFLLKKHNNFGINPNQITIIKQEKLLVIIDNECHLAIEEDNLY